MELLATCLRERGSANTKSCCLLLLIVTALLSRCCSAASSSGYNRDPYHVLGVNPDASQDEIRMKYRKLCLKFHPDKNVGKSDEERKICENMFKQIQNANDLIGDIDSRRKYDLRSKFFQRDTKPNQTFPRHQFRDENVDAFYRAFTGSSQFSSGRPGRDFFEESSSPLFGFSTRDIFTNDNSFGKPVFSNGPLRTVFLQKVKVPLQDLYKGRANMELLVKDSVWKRYCAIFRGGFGYIILYQSMVFALPLLRLSKILTLIFGMFVFHSHVPKPTTLQFTANILPGYKEGTKLIFQNVEDGFDVIFQLEEARHDRFQRRGNNLFTVVDILASQARDGCTIEVESMNPTEAPTTVKLRPNQITQSGDEVTVKNKGWLSRKTRQRGDLVIEFRIVRKVKRKNSKKHSKKAGK